MENEGIQTSDPRARSMKWILPPFMVCDPRNSLSISFVLLLNFPTLERLEWKRSRLPVWANRALLWPLKPIGQCTFTFGEVVLGWAMTMMKGKTELRMVASLFPFEMNRSNKHFHFELIHPHPAIVVHQTHGGWSWMKKFRRLLNQPCWPIQILVVTS